MEKTEITERQAVCPKCQEAGSLDYDYKDVRTDDQRLGYKWTCSECGIKGIEWYFLKFLHHQIIK